MNTKELIAACRDTADALGDANLRISTTKFDSRSVSDLLWAAAAALEAAAPKPMTNGDRIRAMTDEELAESDELLSGLCNVLHGQGYPCEANTCRECLIKWLGSPEKEAAPEPVTSGDRIRAMTAEELAERERLERLYEETRQITDRRAWDETSRTMAYNCGQEANDGQ